MVKIIQWLVFSSADANRISLTVKGFLLSLLPIIITVAGLTSVQLDSESLTAVIEGIATFIQLGFGIVSSIAMIWGVIRKITTTFTGENIVVNELQNGDR